MCTIRRNSLSSNLSFFSNDPEWPAEIERRHSCQTRITISSIRTADPFDFDGKIDFSKYDEKTGGKALSDAPSTTHESSNASSVTAACATTVMIRNIARTASQVDFIEALDYSGFANTYDFAYLPFRAVRCRNLGFAFVNFKTAQIAQSFYEQWHRSNTFMHRGKKSRHVTISTAFVQGKAENIRLIEESCRANKESVEHRPVAFLDGSLRTFYEPGETY